MNNQRVSKGERKDSDTAYGKRSEKVEGEWDPVGWREGKSGRDIRMDNRDSINLY